MSSHRLPRLWPALALACCMHDASAEDRALLISIADYQVPRFSLKGPRNDAQTFKTLLRESLRFKDQQIKVLQDNAATKAGILAALDDWLVKGTAPGDRVVLYYSGHGEQMDDDNHDETDGKDEAIIAYDAADNTDDKSHWVSDDEINQRIAELKGRQILAVIDSCHSGTLTRGVSGKRDAKRPDWNPTRSAGTPEPMDKVHQQEGGFLDGADNLIAFFAVAPNQLAIDDGTAPAHSVFTDALAQGANGKADQDGNGWVSYTELLDYTRRRTADYCQANKNSEACETHPSPMLEMAPARLSLVFNNFGEPDDVLLPAPTPAIATDILAHEGGATLNLAMAPGQTVPLGSEVSYRFSSDKPGKLVLFDINPKGKITQIYPNRHMLRDPHNLAWVNANDPLRIPGGEMKFKLRATGETGGGKIVAVLVEDQAVETDDLIRLSDSTFRVIDNPAAWLGQLRARLNAAFHEKDGGNRAIAWSMAAIDYTVTP